MYNVDILVDYAYSTQIGIKPLIIKEEITVGLTVRQCGDLS